MILPTETAHASLWLGTAQSPEALDFWVEEIYPDEEDEEDEAALTIFWRGFGISWFDHDFMQASVFEPVGNWETILDQMFDELPKLRAAFDAALRAKWGEAPPANTNALILLFSYDYPNDAEKQVEQHSEAGVSMRFAASVPYEIKPRFSPNDDAFPLEMDKGTRLS